MTEILIKRRVQWCYISGPALRTKRQKAGISLRVMANKLKLRTGNDYITMNGEAVSLNKMTIFRIEHSFETALEAEAAEAIEKILSDTDSTDEHRF